MPSIKRITLASQISQSLQDYIKDNHLQEGDKFPSEKEICDMFQVGRSSVREAIRDLETRGIVEIRPGRGVYICSRETSTRMLRTWFTNMDATLADQNEVRMQNELLSVELAAQRATDEELSALKNIHEKFATSVEQNDTCQMASLDEEFHMAIARSTHNPLLIAVMEVIGNVIREQRIKSFSNLNTAKYAVFQHTEILKACEEKDPAQGRRAMQEHIKRTYTDLKGDLE